MPKTPDLVDERFGRILVICQLGSNSLGKVEWVCICDCGSQIKVTTGNLRSGNTTNCGCVRSEKMTQHNLKHGLHGTPEYNAWTNMLQRCYNPKVRNYPWYGARGIKVCNEWRNNFEAFYKHIGPRPGPEYSVDRIDNNGNYEP